MRTGGSPTESVLLGWKIANLADIALLKMLAPALWDQKMPGYRRKTVRMVGAHLHNSRCGHVKQLGRKWKLSAPPFVDNQEISVKNLVVALQASHLAVAKLLETGIGHGDSLPGFPLGAVQFGYYLISHEAHHRGQLLMAARQLGYPLPADMSGKLWQWPALLKK
jgi:hypothetical protein